jgi:hypothetical protein
LSLLIKQPKTSILKIRTLAKIEIKIKWKKRENDGLALVFSIELIEGFNWERVSISAVNFNPISTNPAGFKLIKTILGCTLKVTTR